MACWVSVRSMVSSNTTNELARPSTPVAASSGHQRRPGLAARRRHRLPAHRLAVAVEVEHLRLSDSRRGASRRSTPCRPACPRVPPPGPAMPVTATAMRGAGVHQRAGHHLDHGLAADRAVVARASPGARPAAPAWLRSCRRPCRSRTSPSEPAMSVTVLAIQPPVQLSAVTSMCRVARRRVADVVRERVQRGVVGNGHGVGRGAVARSQIGDAYRSCARCAVILRRIPPARRRALHESTTRAPPRATTPIRRSCASSSPPRRSTRTCCCSSAWATSTSCSTTTRARPRACSTSR